MTEISDRARGHWKTLLPLLGVDAKYLSGTNGPCPVCQGKDRFRFTNYMNMGMWWCNQCEPSTGDGFELVCRVRGWDFYTVAQEVNKLLPGLPEPRMQDLDDKNKKARLALKAIKSEPPNKDVIDYLTGRGLKVPPGIRSHPGLEYYQDGTQGGVYPAMLGLVTSQDDKPVSWHRTYLQDGKKAFVGVPKKMMTPVGTIKGAAIRLYPLAPTIGIAEGIETAIAAHDLFGIPVWSAVSSQGMVDFRPPLGVEEVVIYGDNDLSFTGQAAAYALAKRLVLDDIKVRVEIPEFIGDWNDVLIQGNRKQG